MPDRDIECYNRIRFVMDDADGSLRFRRIGIEGKTFCEDILKQLEAYLMTRPLREVDLTEVRRIASKCRPGCGEELVRIISDQKTFFCGSRTPANRINA